jgi:hypothetical protein
MSRFLRVLIPCYIVLVITLLIAVISSIPIGSERTGLDGRKLVFLWLLVVPMLLVTLLLNARLLNPPYAPAKGTQPGAPTPAFPETARPTVQPKWTFTFLCIAWLLATCLTGAVVILTWETGARKSAAPSGVLEPAVEPGQKQGQSAGPSEEVLEGHATVLLILFYVASFLASLIFIWVAVYLKIRLDQEKERHPEPQLADTLRWRWEFGHLLALEIGIALFVAWFISLTLEWVMRHRSEGLTRHEMSRADAQHKKHLAEQQENLFNALFGFNVNRKLNDEMFQTLHNASKFNREECMLVFEFDSIPDEERARYDKGRKHPNDLLLIRVTVAYKLQNADSARQRFPLRPYFESPLQLGGQADVFTAFRVDGCEAGEGCVSPGELSEQELKEKFAAKGIRRQLTVGEVQVNGKCTANVRYTYRTVKRSCDCHSWISVLPMNGLQIQAVIVDPKLNLQFHVESAHREDIPRIGDSKRAASKVDVWRIENAMLPYQGILLYWYPSVKEDK